MPAVELTRGYLVYLDGSFPLACVLGANARQPKVCPHQVLLRAVKLLDAPDDRILSTRTKKGTKGSHRIGDDEKDQRLCLLRLEHQDQHHNDRTWPKNAQPVCIGYEYLGVSVEKKSFASAGRMNRSVSHLRSDTIAILDSAAAVLQHSVCLSAGSVTNLRVHFITGVYACATCGG